jgi:phage-related protein
VLNFLKTIWNLFTGGVSDIWHYILNLFAAVYNYVDRYVNALAHDITSVYDSLVKFSDSVAHWVTVHIDDLTGLIKSSFENLEKWALGAINDVRNWAVDAYKWTVNEFNAVLKWASDTFNSLRTWIIQHIWQPLDTAISGALDWISKYGRYVWDVISNPEKLAALLATYLLKSWLFILGQWADPIVRFILQRARGLIPDVISLLEDVIDRVLL